MREVSIETAGFYNLFHGTQVTDDLFIVLT